MPGSDRRRGRRARARSPVPAAHRAGARARRAVRPRAGRRPRARRAGARPARRAAALPARPARPAARRRRQQGRRRDRDARLGSTGSRSRRSRAPGSTSSSARSRVLVDEARAAEGEPEPYVVLRPEEQGFSVVREGTQRVARARAGRPSARSRSPTSRPPDATRLRAAEAAAHGRRARARAGRRARRRRRAHRRDRAHLRRGDVSAIASAVVKIGTSSITRPSGELDDAALVKLADDLARARADGHRIVLVMSGAIAAGMPALGLTTRPTDMGTLQAIAAVGQPRLLERMSGLLGAHDVVVGQVLLTPYDFVHRSQYLHARETLQHLLDLGVLPDRQRERHRCRRRDPLRRQRPARGARVAPARRRRAADAHRHRRRVHRRSAPRRRRVADRGDRRGRRGARAGRRAARAPTGGVAAWRASSRPPRSRRGRACAR